MMSKFSIERAEAGLKYLKDLYSDNGLNLDDMPIQESEEIIANMMHAVNLLAEQQEGTEIGRGAYTVNDPDNKLRDLLYAHKEKVMAEKGKSNSMVYDRSPDALGSSHHLDCSKQFGMDFRGGESSANSKSILPNGYKHLLYGELDALGDNKLYLKFEQIGSGNWRDSLEHGMHFLHSGKTSGTDRREKDIDQSIMNAYVVACAKSGVKPLKFDKPKTHARALNMLPVIGGKKYAVKRISTMLKHLEESNVSTEGFIANCVAKGYAEETLGYRTGNEVIVDLSVNSIIEQGEAYLKGAKELQAARDEQEYVSIHIEGEQEEISPAEEAQQKSCTEKFINFFANQLSNAFNAVATMFGIFYGESSPITRQVIIVASVAQQVIFDEVNKAVNKDAEKLVEDWEVVMNSEVEKEIEDYCMVEKELAPEVEKENDWLMV